MSVEVPTYSQYSEDESKVDIPIKSATGKPSHSRLFLIVLLVILAVQFILIIILFSSQITETTVDRMFYKLIHSRSSDLPFIRLSEGQQIISEQIQFYWSNFKLPESVISEIHSASDVALGDLLEQEVNFRTGILNDVQSIIDSSRTTNNRIVIRYTEFSTYSQAAGWMANTELYGGVSPSSWSDGSATASQIINTDSLLNSFFNKKAYPDSSALICANEWYHHSSTNGNFCGALIRVNNTNLTPTTWVLSLYLSSYSGWSEAASVSLNGVQVAVYPDANPVTIQTVSLTLPSNAISRIIVMSASFSPSTTRTNILAFANGCLVPPIGVKFINE